MADLVQACATVLGFEIEWNGGTRRGGGSMFVCLEVVLGPMGGRTISCGLGRRLLMRPGVVILMTNILPYHGLGREERGFEGESQMRRLSPAFLEKHEQDETKVCER